MTDPANRSTLLPMMTVATALARSRSDHQAAKLAKRQGHTALARDHFRSALEHRRLARLTDPAYADPSWLTDALAPARKDEKGRTMPPQYHRIPGRTLGEVVALKDAELEQYFRTELGQVAQVQAPPEPPEIVTPTHWVLMKAGAPDVCPRGHTFQLLTFDQRTCQTCGRVDALRERIAVTETLAFQQAEKERSARQKTE